MKTCRLPEPWASYAIPMNVTDKKGKRGKIARRGPEEERKREIEADDLKVVQQFLFRNPVHREVTDSTNSNSQVGKER